MKTLLDSLRGKKTYITAAVTIVGALGAMASGDMTVADGVQLIVTALIGATLRNGISGK